MRLSWPSIDIFLGVRRTSLQGLNFCGDKDFDDSSQGRARSLWLIRCLCVSLFPHLVCELFSALFFQKVTYVYLGAINKMSKQFTLNAFSCSETWGKKKSVFLEPQGLGLLSLFFCIAEHPQGAVNSWNSCIFIVSMHEHFKAIERLADNDLLILFAILGLFIHHRIVNQPALTLSLRKSPGPKYQ